MHNQPLSEKLGKSFSMQLPTRGIVTTVIVLVFFLIFVNTVDSLWKRYNEYLVIQRDTSYYFEYLGDTFEKVVPTKDKYYVGEIPQFFSNTVYHKEVTMIWKDTLFCKPLSRDVPFTRWATQNWTNVAGVKSIDDPKLPWAFILPLPNYHGECYMAGRPSADINGIRKYTEPYQTPRFQINVPYVP